MITDIEFFERRLRGGDRANFDVEAKRALIDLVQSDVPLGGWVRQLIAGELQEHFFPPSSRERRRQQKHVEAIFFDRLIRHRAQKAKEEGHRDPKTRAEQEVAAHFKVQPEALTKRRQRHR